MAGRIRLEGIKVKVDRKKETSYVEGRKDQVGRNEVG